MATHATGDGGIPPRDAAQRGLKRVMTLGGAYGTRKSIARPPTTRFSYEQIAT